MPGVAAAQDAINRFTRGSTFALSAFTGCQCVDALTRRRAIACRSSASGRGTTLPFTVQRQEVFLGASSGAPLQSIFAFVQGFIGGFVEGFVESVIWR